MRTIEITESGDPSVLQLGERDIPTPSNTQVLVKVSAAGVNGPDIMQRKGLYPPPEGASDLLGLEVSGIVTAVGKSVSRWKEGDAICALTNGGGYAEYVAIESDHCLPIPSHVSLTDSAGIPETYFTVWSNTFFQHDIPPSSTFLVHGGSGGIGTTAIQLGVALGLKVITTCSTPEKCNFCESLGAYKAINYKTDDFVDVVKSLGGADLILNTIGADYIERNFKCANMDARIIQLAFNRGSKIEADLMPIMLKRLTLTGSTLRPRPLDFKSAVAKDLESRVWPLFADNKIKTLTHTTFDLSQASKAHKMMESKVHLGKILLTL